MDINVKILFSMLIVLAMGCSSGGKNETIDLSTIVGKPEPKNMQGAASRKSDQKGHYEVGDGQLNLVDKGEVVTNYSFDEQDADQISFQGLEINGSYGAKVVSYHNTIAFISIKAPEKNVTEYFKTFVKGLGKPDSIEVQDLMLESINDKVKSTLLAVFPETTKVDTNEFNSAVLDYPQRLFWKKGEILYFLSLDPVGDYVNLAIDIITEKALQDHIVIGYHVRP